MKKGKKVVKRHKVISYTDEWIFITIFLVLLIFFISFLSKPQPKDEVTIALEKLTIDSENTNNKLAFIDGNSVDETKLTNLSKLSYDQIRKELGLDKEFYIYFEDPNGKLIPINSKACIGSSKATVNGVRCG